MVNNMQTQHTHTYNAAGKMTCCAAVNQPSFQTEATAPQHDAHEAHSNENTAHSTHNHSDDPESGGGDDDPDGGCCGHDHEASDGYRAYLPTIISLSLLLIGLALSHWVKADFFSGWVEVIWYAVAYFPVGWPVLKAAWSGCKQGEFFTEFSLMSVATLGAFIIKQYPEGVAVMLFYSIGELFQAKAVNRAKSNIKALLDVRPKTATVLREGNYITVNPETVNIGEIIQIKVGEKIPLDGKLLSEKAALNTAALTGESKPQMLLAGESVMAGSLNMDSVIEVAVEKAFNDSSIARILTLVQEASARKSKTELLIRRLAKIYTPIVAVLALLICVLPALFVENYVFSDWLYRALVFLVISCPCALVISIPLGYFGGLGAASQNGLLLKGATYLDQLTKINIIAMDKTGTLTKGVFNIKTIVTNDFSEAELMRYLMAIESKSTHPIAQAIMKYPLPSDFPAAENVQEIAGKGLSGMVAGKSILAGNHKLLTQFGVDVPEQTQHIVESMVLVAIDGVFAGYVTIADELKPDAQQAVKALRALGVSKLVMLSGDKDSITQQVAHELGLDEAAGGLLPEDKLQRVEALKNLPNPNKVQADNVVAFVGDGINDAPVLAASDVSIAMGGLGSDVAIETADVVIQSDHPSKIATGIRIGQSTRRIIWQNIIMAFAVKAIVLIMGALGMATMWAAVFADVGVALLAIMNAVRLQKMNWD